MSLCPKGKSGKLKIAAVLCRASSKRAGVTPGSDELDMICHVWYNDFDIILTLLASKYIAAMWSTQHRAD